jgi:hypothetical protein
MLSGRSWSDIRQRPATDGGPDAFPETGKNQQSDGGSVFQKIHRSSESIRLILPGSAASPEICSKLLRI